MDMSKPRAYVVHPIHGVKMIYLDEREKYLAEGWHRPGQKPAEIKPVEPEKVVDAIKEHPAEAKKDHDEWYEAVKNDASDLSDWLNQTYGLNTNYRQGLAKLQEIANDNRSKNN